MSCIIAVGGVRRLAGFSMQDKNDISKHAYSSAQAKFRPDFRFELKAKVTCALAERSPRHPKMAARSGVLREALWEEAEGLG